MWNIISGIKNFWKYRKVIWNDRWWDYSFMLKLWIFKLEDMVQNWDKAHYEGSNFTKDRMIVILRDLKLLEEDKFEDAIWDEIVYKKWGNPFDYDIASYLENTFVPKDREEEYSEDIARAMIKTDVEKKKVQRRVFDRLRRNYERFWD